MLRFHYYTFHDPTPSDQIQISCFLCWIEVPQVQNSRYLYMELFESLRKKKYSYNQR